MRFVTAQEVVINHKDAIKAICEGVLFDDGVIPVEDYIRLMPTIDKLVNELTESSIKMLHEYATPRPDAVHDW